MKTTVIDDVSGLERIEGSWRDLLARSASAQAFLAPTWVFAWWREFGPRDGRALRAIALEEEAAGERRLVGLALLSIRRVFHRRAIPIRRVELLMTGEEVEHEICSDYVGVLAERGRERDVARAVVRALLGNEVGRWDELLMPAMSGEDPVLAELRVALRDHGIDPEVKQTGECPYIPLPRSFDEYTKLLPRDHRRLVTRSTRELEKWAGPGNWQLVRARTREDLDAGMKVLSALHGQRWAVKGHGGVWASERFSRFHADVMPKLLDGGPDGGLELCWLMVKGEPVAAIYAIVHDGRVQFYQSGRKLEVPKTVQVGIAITALVIEQSIKEGRREYDFLNGVSQYKRQLSLASRPLVRLRAIAPTARAHLLDRARDAVERGVARYRELKKKREAARTPPPEK